MADLILAHDVGTTGDKAALVDAKGRILGTGHAAYPVHYPRTGWAEQDADAWWHAVTSSSRAVLRSTATDPAEVACMTFSTQMLGIVPMGSRGQVLRDPIIWLDERAAAQARRTMRRFGGARAFRWLAGASLGGKDGIPKLRWIREEEPHIHRRMTSFLDVGGYLGFRATGRMAMDWTGASAFGLDLRRKRWLTGVMRLAGVDTAILPDLVRPTETLGRVTPEAAAACGLLAGIPVVAGIGDVQAAAVGAGSVRAGEGHAYLGASGWISVPTTRRMKGRHGAAVLQSADPELNLLFAEMETAGACVQWAAEQLYREEVERLGLDETLRRMDRDVAEVEPGAGRLLFVPCMYGERAPVADTDVRGAFLNVGLDERREHLVRAVFEGVCYHLRWVLETLDRDFGVRLPLLRVVGGGAKSVPWMRVLSDVTGLPVETVADPQDAGARGAALTAAVGLGMHPDFASLADVVEVTRVFEPSPGAEVYGPMFEAYKDAYGHVRRISRRLSRVRARA